MLCTELSGAITVDTTLSDTDTAYCLVDDLTIESSATLTIGPGVTVEFRDADNQLIVDGQVAVENAVLSRGEFADGLVAITVNSGGVFGATNSRILGQSDITVNDGGTIVFQGGEVNADSNARFHALSLNNGSQFFAFDHLFATDANTDFRDRANVTVRRGARANFGNSDILGFGANY